MSTAIRAAVARVLNSREIAINAGENEGIQVGMFFDVMDPKGDDIEDPKSGEILGSIERPKVRVKVTKVQEKLSVASTYNRYQVNVGGNYSDISGTFAKMLMPPKWETRYETLRTEENTWEDLNESESYVKVGDPVVQIVDVEEQIEKSETAHK